MSQLPITPAASPQPSAGIGQTSASAVEGGDGSDLAPGLDFGAVLTKQLKGVASLFEQKEDAGLSVVAVKEGAESAANVGAAVLPVDFGTVLAKQFKGGASLLEQKEVAANAKEAVLPVDFGAVLAKRFKGEASLLGQKEDAGLSSDAVGENAEPAASAGAAVLPVDLTVLTASVLVPALPAQAGGGAGVLAETGTERPLVRLLKAGEIQLAAEIAVNGKNLPQAASPEQMFADKLAAAAEASAGNAGGALHSADLSAAVNPSATSAVFRNPDPLPALPVTPRVGSSEWGGAVGEKIVWMANQSHQVAELHLNPPNLGPLEVRLTISNDQASALFVSHHSAVREAIETALPRLREMLADSGIVLGNVTVGSESFSQQQASDRGNSKEGGHGGSSAESVMARMVVPGRPAGQARDGMVDIFA